RLDDRVTALPDLQTEVAVHLGTAVIALLREVREGGQHVERGQTLRRRLKPRDLFRDAPPQLAVQPRLHRCDALLRTRNARLQRLELRRDVPLGVRERLLALVVRRYALGVRARYLDEIAEHLVVADLQRRNSAALPLLHLQPRDEILRTVARVAQLVQLRIEALPDDVALAGRRTGIVGQRIGDESAHVVERIERRVQRAQQWRVDVSDRVRHCRQPLQRRAQREQLARRRAP